MDPRGEALARAAFQGLLDEAGVAPVQWRRGNQRPDYYLRAGSASYAVEVTRVMESHSVAGHLHSTHGVRAALERLSAKVEREATRAGILAGTYVMTLAPVPNLRAAAPALLAGALSYIAETPASPTAASRLLLPLPHNRRIAIQKVAPSPPHVGAVTLVGPVKRAHVVEADLSRLIGECVQRKRALLARVRLPRVLLLVDSYVYGELQHWRAAAAALDFSGFHTVARIADRGVCHVLYAEPGAWSRRLTTR